MPRGTVGIGLIGCGDIAPTHARAISAAEGVRLVGCMDVVASSAEALGEEYGVAYTTDLDELLADEAVEAVAVATPAFTHAEVVERACDAGKAVICEKPLAANLADADRMIGACAKAGVPLATCLPLRYLGASTLTKGLVEAGALGEIIYLRLRNLGDKAESYWSGGFSGRTITDWRKSKEKSGGGVIITNLIHHLDLARAITGLEMKRAYCEMDTLATDVEVEDVGAACVRYDNGAVGVIEGASCCPGGGDEADVVVLGERGQVRFGLWSSTCELYLREAAAGVPAGQWVTREFEDAQHVAYYEELAKALTEGHAPPVTGEDGRRALEMVLAIYASAETGRPVSLPL